MHYMHLDKLTPGNLAVFALAVVLAWLLYKATQHLVMALLCLVVAVTAAGYLTGVISPAKALEAAKTAGTESLDAAKTGAKALQEKARKATQPIEVP